jgi:hypothetical protein
MKLLIIARSDRFSYIGLTKEDGYTVLTLDDSVTIDVGDHLSAPAWDDRNGLFIEVKNKTKNEDVNICIENWHMTLKTATELLSKLASPTQILWLEPWPEREQSLS